MTLFIKDILVLEREIKIKRIIKVLNLYYKYLLNLFQYLSILLKDILDFKILDFYKYKIFLNKNIKLNKDYTT